MDDKLTQRRRGRPELPVRPDDGPAAALAVALRGLRERAGCPSYRQMSARAHVSPSALSEAARGKRWPSWQTVAGYVTACGEDPEVWRPRWEALRVQEEQPNFPAAEPQEHAADRELPGDTDEPRRELQAWFGRRTGLLAAAVAAATAVAAAGTVLLHAGGDAKRSASAAGALSRASSAATTAQPAAGASVPVRRHGTLILTPGQVADLDSLAAAWDRQPEPGPSGADIWFGAQDHALHGMGNNDIAVLPDASPGGFWPCALDQDYGVTLPASGIRPGRVLCALTAANRVAQLRVIAVHDDQTGTPDRVTLDVTVWVPPHRT